MNPTESQILVREKILELKLSRTSEPQVDHLRQSSSLQNWQDFSKVGNIWELIVCVP